MLSVYQAELCEDMATKPEPAVWEEITVIRHLPARATGRSMGMMVLQERSQVGQPG